MGVGRWRGVGVCVKETDPAGGGVTPAHLSFGIAVFHRYTWKEKRGGMDNSF